MKKILAVLAAVMLMTVSLAATASADQLDTIKERGTLIIATEGNWSPWTYHDNNGVLTGFDIEVGKLIAEWESILAGVDQDRFDLACNGVGYTEERAGKFSFSEPYVYTEAVLVVRKDNQDINAMEDLKGKTTSNSPNSTYAMMAEELGATVQYVDTLGETMMMLEQGRVDATINAKGSVDDYLREHPGANIKIVQTVAGEPVCIPVRKGEDTETLIAAVNEILAKAREDGTLKDLSEKYFGQDLTK